MVAILNMPDVDAEELLYGRMRHLDRLEKLSYAEKGLICRSVESYLLHEQRTDPDTGQPCTFTRWVRLACPWSYATAFAAKRDVEALKDMSDEVIAQIPASHFPVVRQLSTSIRNDPKVIEGITTKQVDDLVDQIREDHPSQHIEHRRLMRFNPAESEAATIEEVIQMAMARGATNWNEALLVVCLEAKEQWIAEAEIAALEGYVEVDMP
jgi:hypothetical protein